MVEVVADVLQKYNIRNVVLDPVMVSTSGHRLIEESAIDTLRRVLIPQARVITPNIPEAEILAGVKITANDQLAEVARQLSQGGTVSVLLKAGHLTEDRLVDIFYNAEQDTITELPSARVYTPNTHGTGCTLSSALAALLARGYELTDAARGAKEYINEAIVSGACYEIGGGHGPVDHFWAHR